MHKKKCFLYKTVWITLIICVLRRKNNYDYFCFGLSNAWKFIYNRPVWFFFSLSRNFITLYDAYLIYRNHTKLPKSYQNTVLSAGVIARSVFKSLKNDFDLFAYLFAFYHSKYAWIALKLIFIFRFTNECSIEIIVLSILSF